MKEQEKQKVDIPEDIQQICREIAQVARKHNLGSISGKLQPPYTNGWNREVSFIWESGRHGEDSGKISISSLLFVNTTIDG